MSRHQEQHLKTAWYWSGCRDKIVMSRHQDLGSLGFTLFSFLFFSFLFFPFPSFLFLSRLFLLVILFLLFFLDLNVIDEMKLNAEINFFSNYYLDAWNFRQISGILFFQFLIAVVLMINRMLYGVIK